MSQTLNINYDPYAPGTFALTFTVNGVAPNLSTGYTATMRIWRSGLPTTAAADVTVTSPSAIALGTAGSIVLDLVVIHTALALVSTTGAVWTYDLIVTPTGAYSQKVCSGQLAEGVGSDQTADVTAPISVNWAGTVGGDLSGTLPNPEVHGLRGRAIVGTAPSDQEVYVWHAGNNHWRPDLVGTSSIANDAVTYAKIQNVSTTDRLLGRQSAGAGDVEEVTCTAAGRAILDDADASAQRTTLGLGTLATQSGTFSGTSSGTNTGDQTITLTGDVTGSGTGSFAATIANDAVSYAKLQNVSATDRLLGRSSAGAGDVEEITCTAAGRAILDDADASAQRTTLGVVAGGAGDIWVEKAGDFVPATSTITSGFGNAWSWQYTAAPASTSTAQMTCFDFAIVNDAPSGVNTGNFLTFSSIGMYPGANADGNVSIVRGAQVFGTVARTTSASTLGTISNTLGLFATAAARFGGTSTATLTNAIAVDIQPVGNAAYTITNLFGLRVQTGGSGNTVTNAIGVDINAQTLGSTTNVGLRVAAASGGSTTAAIQLSGTTGAASGLLFATDVNLYRSAANVLKTDDTFEALNVSGTNTGDQLTYATFTPVDNAPPAANAATSGLRNRIPILEFDDATNETAYFIGIMPQGAKLASGLKVRIHWTAATATSGNCYWAVAFERLNTDIDADSFGADTLSAATTNATSGVPNVTEITVTTIDGITAGDAYRLRIVRQASDALDTMTGDAQIIAVEIRSAV